MINETHDVGAMDSASVADFLLGTWRFTTDAVRSGSAWLHFTPDGRAVQFAVFDADPQCRNPQKFWYEVETAETIRFRPHLEHEGWTRSFLRKDDSSFVLGAGDIDFHCNRLEGIDYPEWFGDALALQLTQFA